jgi:hypothetical protein
MVPVLHILVNQVPMVLVVVVVAVHIRHHIIAPAAMAAMVSSLLDMNSKQIIINNTNTH